MKRWLFLFTCLIHIGFVHTTADASEMNLVGPGGWGLSLGYGQSLDGVHIYRAGLLKQLQARWFESHTGYICGYFELSCNRWAYGGEDVAAVAFSPVFQYFFHTEERVVWHPYIEAGVGAAWLDRDNIHDRDLASTLLFEDRVGAGIRMEHVDISLRYMHYSNAGLKGSNDGIDILIGTLAWYF